MVTAADRAAATCKCQVTTKLLSERAEGVAGAIGKPPPRLDRGETLPCGGFAATPCLFSQKEGTIRGANGGRYTLPPQQCTPQQKSLSSVSLTADSSFCGGSLLAVLPAKPPQKGLVPAAGGRRGSPPYATKVAAALSAAVTTTTPIGETPTFQAEPSKQKRPTQTPAALRERGSGREALLSEKRPLPRSLPLVTSSFPLVRRGGRG